MVHGTELFFSLFNNLAIFIALVATYGYILAKFSRSIWMRRQTVIGFAFGTFAIGCMYAKIPVFEGVIVDQRNAVMALSGAFGGPWSALISVILAGSYRIFLGGSGALAGVIGVCLAAGAGVCLNRFPNNFTSGKRAAVSALFATVLILPGFLFVRDFHTGWELMKAMAMPYGLAIFCGIFFVGLLLNRQEERYAFELSFKESEKKYRQLVEGTQDLITHTDKHGNFTFSNHMSKKILGVTPEEIVGMSAFSFTHPDDREQTIEWFNRHVAEKEAAGKIENRQVNIATDNSHTLMWSASYHFDNHGELTGVGSIARDITQVRAVEKKYENLFNTMPDSYIIHEVLCNDNGDPVDYRFLSINPVFEKITGLKTENLIGKTVQEAFPDRGKYWIDTYNSIALKQKTETFEHFFEELNKHFEVTAFRPEENLFACILHDISKRKKAEEEKKTIEIQLRHTQKMEAIGTLSGGIAHDFNNILAAILGYAEMANESISDSNPARDRINEVIKAGYRAKDLVKQILAFSRKAELARSPVNVQLLIKETIKFLRATIPANIRIESYIEPDSGYILADSTQIHQVLMNLFTNASHAMEDDGGTLGIYYKIVQLTDDDAIKEPDKQPGPYIMISIKDTGTGINKDHLERIFDPYFTTKKMGKGSGMGLSVVHGIVKKHGGMIHVNSQSGKGTTFKLLFPKINSFVTEQASKDTDLPCGKGNILVLDDDESIATLTRKRVEILGYTALVKTNSLETLELFKSDPMAFDLVITDQSMPDMTGVQLAKKLIDIRNDIPIILCTGYSSTINRNKAIDIGIRDFLMKPFDKEELATSIRRALNSS